MTIYPDICIILGDNRLIDLGKQILNLGKTVIFEYDTTFNLGNFFLSYIACQNTLLEKQCYFPLGFMIHTRKCESFHQIFWTLLSCKLGLSNNDALIIATDREPGIVNAIKTVLPTVPQVFCYNHILRNVRQWIFKEKLDADICKDVGDLFQTKNMGQFEICLEEKMSVWPEKFKTYYHRYLALDVLNNKKFLPSTYITTNGIERYNRTIKDWCNHKEQDLDRMVLLLKWLQLYTLQQQTCEKIQVLNLSQLIDKYKTAVGKSSVFENEWSPVVDQEKVSCICSFDKTTQSFSVQHQINKSLNSVHYKGNVIYCSCGATIKCIHIFAVEKFTGIKGKERKYSERLLPLVTRKAGKSGRKKPRRIDNGFC